MAALADSRIGTELAGYRIEELIGRGGMGVVYRARDLALDRNVALKLLAPHLADDVSFRERFLKESRVAASLEHPNVVPIHDAGEIDGQLYIAMRQVEGSDLKKVLGEGPLEPPRAVPILEQIAGALDAAHARGLVHRDVKPSNVLLDEREHVYLADFGLSRYLGDAALPLGPARSLGTADYVAPEQIRGDELDGRADVYALGCMLYECLAGEPPFRRGSDAATLYAQLEEVPPVLPGLEELLPKALAKERAYRYESCGAFVHDVRQALGLEPKRARWPLVVAGVGATLLGAALLAFFLNTSGSNEPKPEPGADILARIDPATSKVVYRIPVGRKATAVTLGGGFVWVANSGEGSVWRITPKSGDVLKLPVHATPTDIAVMRGQVVVANGPDGSVENFDAQTGASAGVTQLTAAGAEALVLSNSGQDVWFGAASDQRVGAVAGEVVPTGDPTINVRIAPNRHNLLATYTHFNGLAASNGTVWVSGDPFGRYVWRVDMKTQQVAATIPIPAIPDAIASDGRAVWVTSLLDDRVLRIDPESNRVVARIAAPRGAYSIATGAGAVWVIGALDHALARIDPSTNQIAGSVALDGTPIDVAVGPDDVWVLERRS